MLIPMLKVPLRYHDLIKVLEKAWMTYNLVRSIPVFASFELFESVPQSDPFPNKVTLL